MSQEQAQKQVVRIAVDAMGGDFAPENEIIGALSALRRLGNSNCQILFLGKEDSIKKTLSKHDTAGLNFEIVHAGDVVTMDDHPTEAYKKKKDSSLYRGIQLHSQKKADAFVSTGNTGAVMSTATLMLGRIKGVSRPTIGAFFPTLKENPTLLIDVGANAECRAQHLFEFGVMGSIYSRQILGNSSPKVALLNIGEEATKGNNLVLEAYPLFAESSLNFIGNVEGRDIMTGECDVIICDGFTGNIVLKFAESIISILRAKVRQFAERGLWQKIAAGLIAPILRKILKDFDYQKYGGVPLLGVNGVVIIGHGKSTPLAIENMIVTAVNMVQKEVNASIEAALQAGKSA